MGSRDIPSQLPVLLRPATRRARAGICDAWHARFGASLANPVSHRIGCGRKIARGCGGMEAYESLSMSDRKGRLGVNYVCAVVAQAALPNPEFKPGEDHLAVDLNVEFPASPVRVQVKCGTRKANRSGSISVPLNAKWRARWAQSKIPVYLVYVCLERNTPGEWIDHCDDTRTVMHAHAHWLRVNGVSGASVSVPLANRLSASTFATWNHDAEACFGEVEGS